MKLKNSSLCDTTAIFFLIHGIFIDFVKTASSVVRDSPEVLDGANADSAQRCKARSERHQRIGDRVVWFLVLPLFFCTYWFLCQMVPAIIV